MFIKKKYIKILFYGYYTVLMYYTATQYEVGLTEIWYTRITDNKTI